MSKIIDAAHAAGAFLHDAAHTAGAVLHDTTLGAGPIVHSVIVHAAGVIDEGNKLAIALQGLIKNGGFTAFLIAFLWICHKKGWALAGFLGGLALAGIGYFAINGGMELVGNMFKQQFGLGG